MVGEKIINTRKKFHLSKSMKQYTNATWRYADTNRCKVYKKTLVTYLFKNDTTGLKNRNFLLDFFRVQ